MSHQTRTRTVRAPSLQRMVTAFSYRPGDSVSQGTPATAATRAHPADAVPSTSADAPATRDAVTSHGAARGYSWPPAEPGNLLALKHGAFSRYVIPEADELATVVLDSTAHLGDADAAAVRDYAIAQVRAWRLAAWVEQHGVLDARGRISDAAAELRRWLDRAEKARGRLGLDPVSRAALAVDEITARRNAGAMAREELAEGRRLREQAEARLIDATTGQEATP